MENPSNTFKNIFDLFYLIKQKNFKKKKKLLKWKKKKKKKAKKEYFKDGKFKLTKELIDRIPCISSVGYSIYAIDINGK